MLEVKQTPFVEIANDENMHKMSSELDYQAKTVAQLTAGQSSALTDLFHHHRRVLSEFPNRLTQRVITIPKHCRGYGEVVII